MMNGQARGSLILGESDELLSVVMCFHCGSSNFAAHHFCRDCGQPLGARYLDLCLAQMDDAEAKQRVSIPQQLRGPLQLFLMGLAVSILLTIVVVMVLTLSGSAPIS
jgi:hypothetical protein